VKAEARDEGQSGHSHTLRGVAEARELKRHLCGSVGNERKKWSQVEKDAVRKIQ
jgi:hypothetical protein